MLEVDGAPARRRARHLRRRALAHHVDGPGGPRRLDADGQAPRRSGRGRQARAGAPRDRGARRQRSRLHVGRGRLSARASSPRSSRPPSSSSTTVISTPPASPSCSGWHRRRASASRSRRRIDVGWERIWSIEPILFDRSDRALRRGLPRRSPAPRIGFPSGPLHDAAEVCACGRPDRDAVRAEPARALAHEARGHARGASRAGGRRADRLRRDHRRVSDERLGPGCPARRVAERHCARSQLRVRHPA